MFHAMVYGPNLDEKTWMEFLETEDDKVFQNWVNTVKLSVKWSKGWVLGTSFEEQTGDEIKSHVENSVKEKQKRGPNWVSHLNWSSYDENHPQLSFLDLLYLRQRVLILVFHPQYFGFALSTRAGVSSPVLDLPCLFPHYCLNSALNQLVSVRIKSCKSCELIGSSMKQHPVSLLLLMFTLKLGMK